MGKGAHLHAQSSEFNPKAPHGREPMATSYPLNSMSAELTVTLYCHAGSMMYQNERSNYTK